MTRTRPARTHSSPDHLGTSPRSTDRTRRPRFCRTAGRRILRCRRPACAYRRDGRTRSTCSRDGRTRNTGSRDGRTTNRNSASVAESRSLDLRGAILLGQRESALPHCQNAQTASTQTGKFEDSHRISPDPGLIDAIRDRHRVQGQGPARLYSPPLPSRERGRG